jgi:hypothetical protein
MGAAAWAGIVAAFAAVVVAMPAIPKDTTGRRYWLAGGVSLMLVAAGLGVTAMQGPENQPTTIGTTTPPTSITSPKSPTPLTTAITAVYLDSGRFPPTSGGDRIVDVPREIEGKEGYKTHPIAIRCPTNEMDDQSSVVTFSLRGRYGQFIATVHPFYPPTANQQAATHFAVTVAGSPLSNNRVISEAARQNDATPTNAQAVVAAMAGAETMTLRIQCADPAGTIVLTDARFLSS